MADFPHTYRTLAVSKPTSILTVSSDGKEDITTSPPEQFGGPKGYWTPEDYFSAAISSCFILTFKNYSREKN